MNNLANKKEYNPLELLHSDVRFALEELNEQVAKNEQKDLFIYSERELFEMISVINYLETNPAINEARIVQIFYDCINIIKLSNTVFAQFEYSESYGDVLRRSDDCEYITIEGCNSKRISYEEYVNSPYRSLFTFYENLVFANKCISIISVITAFNERCSKESFYVDLVFRLYSKNYSFKNIDYDDPYTFIDAKHKTAEEKGIDFYQKILDEYKYHLKAKTVIKTSKYFYDESIELVNYCNNKVAEYESISDNILIDAGLEIVVKNPNILKNADQANENNSVKSNNAGPKFKSDIVDDIFNILKDFFSQEHQNELKEILVSGSNARQKLIFLDTGNRLADAFKQLYDADFITSCQKNELEKWISENFSFRYRGIIKEFKTKYLNDIISTTKDKCQKPLLDVKGGIISNKT